MFKKKCVAVAVGLALIQFSPAWAEICTDCTLINESLSLTEKDRAQKKISTMLKMFSIITTLF